MQLPVIIHPRRKPLMPCVGCGAPLAKYSDYNKGHVHSGDEVGFVCVLCHKTVCASCLYHSDMIIRGNKDWRLLQDYQLFSVQAQGQARDPVAAYACIRCIAKFEMGLIRKIGYTELPFYLEHKWLTRAARKYFEGILEGRYECPDTPEKT